MSGAVIDVHTHMLTKKWLEMLAEHGGEKLDYKINPASGKMCIFKSGAPFMTPNEAMSDYDLRVKKMNEAGVDVAIVSLTCPNVYFGGEAVSVAAARNVNDDMAAAKTAYPDRIRWFASLPWQYAASAIAELDRAIAAGASGVVVLGNIDGEPLTAPQFAPVWQAIDDRRVPVFIHPTAPPGTEMMGLERYALAPPMGFTFDTSLAIARMLLDGFFIAYPNVRIIAGHGAGTLPYLIGRIDFCWEKLAAASEKIDRRPSEYLGNVFADAVLYRQEALELCVNVLGEQNVMYGSDYPHHIGDMVGCLSRVNALESGLRVKVRSTNAEKLFGL